MPGALFLTFSLFFGITFGAKKGSLIDSGGIDKTYAEKGMAAVQKSFGIFWKRLW